MTIKKSSKIIKERNVLVEIFLILFLLGNGESFSNENDDAYTVHPPQLSVPRGGPGETRRIIMQFYNWTLICDEKKSLHQGICNVTQTVHDQRGNTIFSWSLVSTKNGQAVMLFRTLPKADTSVPIQIFVDGVKKPILIHYKECSRIVCLAQSPVEPILTGQIEKNKDVRISYKMKEGKIFSFIVPFKGLSAALYSLQK
ncbi:MULTISPECIES: invasion associated locus B family protein [unclassified Bartonella]|uniref:invasion associated locus B family protein n=1 Tax=unclassified Bartonella TaxID=2645622 RepID=UPI00300E452F